MTTIPVLVTTIAHQVCVFPVEHVVETLRPPTVRDNTCVHRGETVPVVDAPTLRGHAEPPRRCVVVRVGERRVAVLVDDVIAVRAYDAAELAKLPAAFAPDQLRELSLPVATALGLARELPETT